MQNYQFLANMLGSGMFYYPQYDLRTQNYWMENGFNLYPFIPQNFVNLEAKEEDCHSPTQPVESQQQVVAEEQEFNGQELLSKSLGEKEKDRNMISNSLKVFRKYVKDSSCFQDSPIQKVIKIRKLDYSSSEFLRDLDEAIPKDRNYLGAKFLTSLTLRKKHETNFRIVFRTVLHYYYRKMVFPTVSTSLKILKDAKKRQLIGARKIRQMCME